MSSELFILRAIELAKLGRGKVSPNPLVGAVLVKNGKVIGEGYHQKYGEAHAEANAIKHSTEEVWAPLFTARLNLVAIIISKHPRVWTPS